MATSPALSPPTAAVPRPVVTPVFILSPPRSGSTLVQRVLAAHDDVATASEPWLLLPLLAPLREHLPIEDNWHAGIHHAVVDFRATLPEGAYERAMREAALRLYAEASPEGARIFVDKTPPYAMIADQIADVFPDGRLIFLWRHPLAVVASVLDTFGDGRWRPNTYPVSLFSSPVQLADAYGRLRDRAFAARYEDLVRGDEPTWRALCEHAGLEFQPAALAAFSDVGLAGRMGDPTGVHRYGALSDASVDRWKAVVNTPLRRWWCERYLRWLGAERLAVMGYDLDALLAELAAVPVGMAGMGADAADTAATLARDIIKERLPVRGRVNSWRSILGA